jgi:hypothetical protein
VTARRTYSERRSYSAKVMKWRLAIYAPRSRATGSTAKPVEELTNGCRVLLLRLSDDMDARGYVSVPRSELAADLDVATARITEWIAMAERFRLLDRVVRGRPGVTAVYACKLPDEVRPGVPSKGRNEVRQSRPREVRPGVPENGPAWYATAVPPEVGTDGSQNSGADSGGVCQWHQFDSCPADCANSEAARKSA